MCSAPLTIIQDCQVQHYTHESLHENQLAGKVFLDTWNTLSSSSSCHWLKFVRDLRLLSSSLSESEGEFHQHIVHIGEHQYHDCPHLTLISTFCKLFISGILFLKTLKTSRHLDQNLLKWTDKGVSINHLLLSH